MVRALFCFTPSGIMSRMSCCKHQHNSFNTPAPQMCKELSRKSVDEYRCRQACMHLEEEGSMVAHHDGSAQLQIKVGLDALLGDGLGNALGLAPLELARQQVAQPALQQGHDAAQEEEPHAPHWRPEAYAGALAHGARVEPVVHQVLQVLQKHHS